MSTTKFLRILSSLPVVLLVLYFIPWLGIILLIIRYAVGTYKVKKNTTLWLILFSILLFVPKIIQFFCELFSIHDFPYIHEIVGSEIYTEKIISYAGLLFILALIWLICSWVFGKIFQQIQKFGRRYIKEELQQERTIKQENDLIMQEKREKAKQSRVVVCPYCGADNLLSAKTGKCMYCRRKIE